MSRLCQENGRMRGMRLSTTVLRRPMLGQKRTICCSKSTAAASNLLVTDDRAVLACQWALCYVHKLELCWTLSTRIACHAVPTLGCKVFAEVSGRFSSTGIGFTKKTVP